MGRHEPLVSVDISAGAATVRIHTYSDRSAATAHQTICLIQQKWPFSASAAGREVRAKTVRRSHSPSNCTADNIDHHTCPARLFLSRSGGPAPTVRSAGMVNYDERVRCKCRQPQKIPVSSGIVAVDQAEQRDRTFGAKGRYRDEDPISARSAQVSLVRSVIVAQRTFTELLVAGASTSYGLCLKMHCIPFLLRQKGHIPPAMPVASSR